MTYILNRSKIMKVIMTGGGTGEHIYPAIAIADRIMERNNNPEILFVGTEKGLEKELVPKSGYNMKFITVSGISRKHLLRNFKVAREYIAAKRQAKKIIRDLDNFAYGINYSIIFNWFCIGNF